jgi:hypothetical protein
MHEGNGGDLEIHGPNAHTLSSEPLKRSGRLLIKRQEVPRSKKINESNQSLVILHLQLHVYVVVTNLFEGSSKALKYGASRIAL